MKKYTYKDAIDILEKLKNYKQYVVPENGPIKEILITKFNEDKLEHGIYPLQGELVDEDIEVEMLVVFSINNSSFNKSISFYETIKLSKRIREALASN